MRHLLLVAVITLAATAVPVQAQILPSFGVTGGLNFGSLSDAATVDLDQSTGYHVGVFGDVGFGPVGLRASILYVRAGSLSLPTAGSDNPTVSFVSIPIDLQYGLGLPLVNPYLLAGPEARLPVGDLADADARGVAVAINVGVGAEVSAFIGPKVFAELRYAFDVTGFFDDGVAGIPATSDESIQVNLFFFRVGVGL
jgi:hypothetical protein